MYSNGGSVVSNGGLVYSRWPFHTVGARFRLSGPDKTGVKRKTNPHLDPEIVANEDGTPSGAKSNEP